MKQLLFVSLAAIFTFAFIHPLVHAQGLSGDSLDIQSTQAVAFLKTDRSIIYIKRPGQPVDAYDIGALDVAGSDPNPMDSIRKIGIIGMTPQGDRMVIGAAVHYLNNTNGTHDLFVGFLSIPWPMTASSLNNTPIKFLVPTSAVSFRPSGVMSADGTEWWAVGSSSSAGTFPLIFDHGRTDGTGTIDSAQVTASITGNSPLNVYQVSNIEIDQPSKTMFATSFDGLQSQKASGRAFFYLWNPDHNIQLTASNFTGSMGELNQAVFGDFDSIYGITVAPAEDAASVYIGCRPASSDLGLYQVLYTGTSVNVPSTPAYTILRSALPNQTFFAGPDCGSVTPPYSETLGQTNKCAPGNSGDVNFSVWGDTAVFTTHDWPDTCTYRGKESAIWTYDLAQGILTFIYNDSGAQELQPVFVTAKDTIPHSPGITGDAPPIFGPIDTAATATQLITITDTSQFAGTIIDSAKITGLDAADFTITTPIINYTLPHNSKVKISVTFAPTMTAGLRKATLTVYSSMSTNQFVAVNLTGKATVKSGGGSVAEDPALEANMAIDPNPFNSQTSVRLTAQEAGALGIVVHDALGRTVYTSDVRRVSAGTTETFTFDANTFGLASGVYIVTGLFGDRSASREVVRTK
jgi:hypothetical protein